MRRILAPASPGSPSVVFRAEGRFSSDLPLKISAAIRIAVTESIPIWARLPLKG